MTQPYSFRWSRSDASGWKMSVVSSRMTLTLSLSTRVPRWLIEQFMMSIRYAKTFTLTRSQSKQIPMEDFGVPCKRVFSTTTTIIRTPISFGRTVLIHPVPFQRLVRQGALKLVSLCNQYTDELLLFLKKGDQTSGTILYMCLVSYANNIKSGLT